MRPDVVATSRPIAPDWALAQLNEPFEQLVTSAFEAREITEALHDPALSEDSLRQALHSQREKLVLSPSRELQELAVLVRRSADSMTRARISPSTSWGRLRERLTGHLVSLLSRDRRWQSGPVRHWLERWWVSTGDNASDEWLEQRRVLEAELEVARGAFTAAVFERGVKRALRSLIDDRTETSYLATLTVDSAPGLAELTRDDIDVSMGVADALQHTMRGMSGGSIGVAGPRGIGKTTLLEAFRRGNRSIREEQRQPPLAVLVSAPVAYDGRDFILHLFAQLCETVIAGSSPGDSYPPTPSSQTSAQRRDFVLFVSRLVSRAFLLAGAVLLAVVLFVPHSSERDAIAIGAILATLGLVLIGPRALGGVSLPLVKLSLNSVRDAIALTILRSLAAIALPAGVLLVTLASLNHLPNTFVLWSAAIVLIGTAAVTAAHFITKWFTLASDLYGDPRPIDGDVHDALVPIALRWRDRIRYQQRYTSGWSGGLKASIGFEFTRSAGTDASDQQLTFPDAVDSLRRFLLQATRDRDVLIAIDELDKIESSPLARRFLNEVKAIFGIEHCFYLIAVSEDAMSQFERRGLPVRDVLDSSFDEVVYMDRLTISDARHVISQRVVGLPVPFLFLVHVLSGGLPRDLIRATRVLIEHRVAAKRPLGVGEASTALVGRDVQRKSRAAELAARAFPPDQELSGFIRWLRALQRADASSDAYLGFCERLQSAVSEVLPMSSRGEGDGAEPSTPLDLARDVAIVVYFAATVIELFAQQMSRSTLRALWSGSHGTRIDDLAEVRAVFSSNRRLAWEMLSDFRESMDMTVTLSYPELPRAMPPADR
jgi:hypothetical protein